MFFNNVTKKHFGHECLGCNIDCYMNTNFQNNKLGSQTVSKNLESWDLSSLNYILFICGIITILLGYIIMATGEVNSFQSLNIAPLFLFFGYIILIPLSLIIESKDN